MKMVELINELKVYESKKEELLKKYEGKVVVIKGDTIVGIYDNEEEALKEVLQKFGYVPVLIKRILRKEPSENIPAYTYGLLSVYINTNAGE